MSIINLKILFRLGISLFEKCLRGMERIDIESKNIGNYEVLFLH